MAIGGSRASASEGVSMPVTVQAQSVACFCRFSYAVADDDDASSDSSDSSNDEVGRKASRNGSRS